MPNKKNRIGPARRHCASRFSPVSPVASVSAAVPPLVPSVAFVGFLAHVRPRLLTDLSPELAALIEDVTVDNRGRLTPRLYSKLQANKELRAMLNISAKEAPKDITQLSDQELIARLAQQARELGVQINLDYHFARQPPAAETDRQENHSSILRARAMRRASASA